jgi:hypothetical protein
MKREIIKFKDFQHNEGIYDVMNYILIGYFVYKFLKGLLLNYIRKSGETVFYNLLDRIKSHENLKIIELNDRFYFTIEVDGVNFDMRIFKKEKTMTIDPDKKFNNIKIKLTEQQYDDFMRLLNNFRT